jgi:hypothetical protein
MHIFKIHCRGRGSQLQKHLRRLYIYIYILYSRFLWTVVLQGFEQEKTIPITIGGLSAVARETT